MVFEVGAAVKYIIFCSEIKKSTWSQPDPGNYSLDVTGSPTCERRGLATTATTLVYSGGVYFMAKLMYFTAAPTSKTTALRN